MDSVGEGEGGKIWENGIEKKKKKNLSLISTYNLKDLPENTLFFFNFFNFILFLNFTILC